MPLRRRKLDNRCLNSRRFALTQGAAGEGSLALRGFTVLELLVVLAVVLIMCALILPAMQHAREASRQVRCKNQLHQIGVALHAYHERTNCLPPGWIIEVPIGENSQNGWGWLAMLLPHLDQSIVVNSINFNLHLGNESNKTARMCAVEAFVCPSDNVPARIPFYLADEPTIQLPNPVTRQGDTSDPNRMASHSVMFEVATSSYVGVFGPDVQPFDPVDAAGSGIFFANSKSRFGDVTDGLSQTLVVGERKASWICSTWTGIHQLEEERFERVVGFTNNPPNSSSSDEAEFSSRHPGGVNFLFGDGSVRFISDHIDRTTYQALGTRSGQEVIGMPKF
jgi:prepilin-type processing-associated H-X9-DG protein/prepilin-type N-terminal cleavage/methylation domain-containing protein